MPNFRYTASTPDGKRIEGSARAPNWKQVEEQLRLRGLKMTGISEVADSPKVPVQAVRTPASSDIHDAAAPTAQTRFKTRFSKDKEIFFLFSQIARYLSAGVNPAEAMGRLADANASGKFPASLRDLAGEAAAGRPVAERMRLYPYLFPPHVAGIYAAGERGGFLPDACETIAEQARQSHKFKVWYFWLGLTVASLLASIPMLWWALKGFEQMWVEAERSGGSVQGWPLLAKAFGSAWKATYPWIFGFGAICIVCYIAWQSLPMRSLRHKLVLFVPSTRKRVRNESMMLFAWGLSNLFRGGIAPKPSVELAAECMPNLELARQMRVAATHMKAETRLSEIASQTSLLTPELKSIVMTGEFVGDLPGALANVAEAQRSEFEAASHSTKMRIGCWMAILILMGSALLFGIFYRNLADSLFKNVLDDSGPSSIRSK